MLEREKLSGSNFNDWFCQLRIVLRDEKKLNVLEQPMTLAPTVGAPNNELEDWNAQCDRHNVVSCLMLSSMSHELQRKFENYASYDMLQELKSMFEKQARVERIQKPSKKLQAAKGKGKGKGNGKSKLAYAPKPRNPSPVKKKHEAKDAACHHYKEVALESATRILNMVPTKKVDKTPYELWSKMIRQALDHLCLNVEVEEHSLGDLDKPTNYTAALSYPESIKWLDDMSAKMAFG
uniref:Zinc finger, CCHC-type n=1 Tax=Tanacetum cinerariifolium TaxID=118510 RepID=A0A699HVM1_TANCI|nr:hypothetical protein [Tanacetum cinerariifolium]